MSINPSKRNRRKAHASDKDSKGDSIASASSDELDHFDSEDFKEEDEVDDGSVFEFIHLFLPKESNTIGKAKNPLFSPLDKSGISQHLHLIIDACNLVLA